MWFINPTFKWYVQFQAIFDFFQENSPIFHFLPHQLSPWMCVHDTKIHKAVTNLFGAAHFWYHQLFHFVLTCVQSLSHFVVLHPLLNNGVNHQMIPYLFFKLGPHIKLSRQPNMCLSKPVPLTCNISAGTDPSNPYFRSPKGMFSKALEMFFCINLFNHPQSNVLVSILLMWWENTLVWD